MEGRNPYTVASKANNLIHTFPHLACRFIGKCDGKNIPWIHTAFFNQICDSMSQYPCFSRTSPCQNQQWPFCIQHRLFLFIIQCIVNTHMPPFQIFGLFPLNCTVHSTIHTFEPQPIIYLAKFHILFYNVTY